MWGIKDYSGIAAAICLVPTATVVAVWMTASMPYVSEVSNAIFVVCSSGNKGNNLNPGELLEV